MTCSKRLQSPVFQSSTFPIIIISPVASHAGSKALCTLPYLHPRTSASFASAQSYSLHLPSDTVLQSESHRGATHITRLCLGAFNISTIGTLDAALALERVKATRKRRVLLNLLRNQMPERGIQRGSHGPVDRGTISLAGRVLDLPGRTCGGQVWEGVHCRVEGVGFCHVPGACVDVVHAVARIEVC